MKTIEPTLLLDSNRGIYSPQAFAKFDRSKIRNVTDEQWAILEAGPNHELYYDVWTEVLDNARIIDNHGTEYSLYQDGDVWAIPTTWEWVEELNWFAPSESDTLMRFTLPEYWASYLINGDASGVSDEEKASVDRFIEVNELQRWTCADVSEHTWFSRWCDAPGQLAGTMALYTFVLIGGAK